MSPSKICRKKEMGSKKCTQAKRKDFQEEMGSLKANPSQTQKNFLVKKREKRIT
jgi:hypothetical protein